VGRGLNDKKIKSVLILIFVILKPRVKANAGLGQFGIKIKIFNELAVILKKCLGRRIPRSWTMADSEAPSKVFDCKEYLLKLPQQLRIINVRGWSPMQAGRVACSRVFHHVSSGLCTKAKAKR
jgi:hypothetical protein